MGCAASAGADRPPSQAPSVAPDHSEKSKEIDRMLKADGKAAACASAGLRPAAL
jgi:hypothetical protein